jgi:hypothetical protein
VVRAAGGADLNGAAGGAAERFQWSCGWCSDIFSDFDMRSCVWQWQQQHRALQVVQWWQLQVVQQIMFSGAAGGAAEKFQWSCGWCSDVFSDFDVCSCVVAVAAAAQGTAGGAAVTAAGGAADYIQWSCKWCSREISVELRMVQRCFQRF